MKGKIGDQLIEQATSRFSDVQNHAFLIKTQEKDIFIGSKTADKSVQELVGASLLGASKNEKIEKGEKSESSSASSASGLDWVPVTITSSLSASNSSPSAPTFSYKQLGMLMFEVAPCGAKISLIFLLLSKSRPKKPLKNGSQWVPLLTPSWSLCFLFTHFFARSNSQL